jgi:hypothetical protein
MSKETVVTNKSTQLFLDLAIRSLEVSWKLFQEINGDGDANDYLDDPDFMSPFIMHVIGHIQNNFEKFTTRPKKEISVILMKLTSSRLLLCWCAIQNDSGNEF